MKNSLVENVIFLCNDYVNTFEKREGYRCLFQRKAVTLNIPDHCKWPSEIMAAPLKCMAANAPLKYIV